MYNPHSYVEYRTTIESGDVFFTYSPKPFSRLIRWGTGSKISHVGVFLWIENRLFIVEMLEGRDCIMIPASNRFKNVDFYHGKPFVCRTVLEDFTSEVLEDVGTVKYSIWLAVKSFFIITKSSQSFCSASVARWLNMGFDLQTRGIMPNDIVNRCRQPLTLVTPK